jgi:hypothetical protein
MAVVVDGDDITRDRHCAKCLWLIYGRQRTKWISWKLRGIDPCSAPFEMAQDNRTKSVVQLTEGNTEAGIKSHEILDSKKLRAKTSRESNFRMFTSCEKIVKEKQRYFPDKT